MSPLQTYYIYPISLTPSPRTGCIDRAPPSSCTFGAPSNQCNPSPQPPHDLSPAPAGCTCFTKPHEVIRFIPIYPTYSLRLSHFFGLFLLMVIPLAILGPQVSWHLSASVPLICISLTSGGKALRTVQISLLSFCNHLPKDLFGILPKVLLSHHAKLHIVPGCRSIAIGWIKVWHRFSDLRGKSKTDEGHAEWTIDRKLECTHRSQTSHAPSHGTLSKWEADQTKLMKIRELIQLDRFNTFGI